MHSLFTNHSVIVVFINHLLMQIEFKIFCTGHAPILCNTGEIKGNLYYVNMLRELGLVCEQKIYVENTQHYTDFIVSSITVWPQIGFLVM